MFSETLEKFVSITVNTTSSLPNLSMSEGPVSIVSLNYIKGWLTVTPQDVRVLSSSWVLFSSLSQSGPSRVPCVYECCAVLEYACSLNPAWNPDQFALTHVLGATRIPDPSRALGLLLKAMRLYVRGPSADTPLFLSSFLLPCHLVPNGTNKLSASLLGVLCWDWLKGGDWLTMCDVSTDSRTQPPRPGHVACLCMCVTGFWLLDCNVIPLWEKKLI